MKSELWVKITQMLREAKADQDLGLQICNVAAELLRCKSVSLALIINHSYSQIASSDDVAAFMDEEQFALGNGPTFDAQSSSLPVMVPDLSSKLSMQRWPAFIPIAKGHQVAGVFAFPLRMGNAYLGTLTAYRNFEGELSVSEYTAGLILATLATEQLLRLQSGAEKGGLAEIFEAGMADQSSLHLSAGMVAESLNCSVVEALVRIRAFAFREDVPVSLVARKIIKREITLEK